MAESTKPLKDVYKKLFLSNSGDIIIKLKNDETLKVHEVLISARSEVFKKMLTSSMQETKTKTIDMTTYDPERVKELFLYLYCEEYQQESKTVASIFEFMKLLDMFNLHKYCEKISNILEEKCTLDDAWDLLPICFENQKLYEKLYQKLHFLIYHAMLEQTKLNFHSHEYKCYDDMIPGQKKHGIVIRPNKHIRYMCCEHWKSNEEKKHLQRPLSTTKYNGRQVCIAYTKQGIDPTTRDSERILCCRHRNKPDKKIAERFINLSSDIRMTFSDKLFGISDDLFF